MNKLKMKTEDLTSENIEKLKELFPSVVSDGKIDFDKLKQELSADIVKTVDSYDFTWVGKHEAVRKANEPVNAVLRPCPEESKNWEKTKNIYIEGDNLDVLKVLYKSYAGQIKMIYIDPPYNTGSDLIYNDTFTQNLKEYNSAQHLSDEQGLRLKKVTDTDGNYHSKWCSMMYPRLKMARKLLSEDGVIFISIDDHEQANLKKICDEIFGAEKFVADFLWKKKSTTTNVEGVSVSSLTEYILCYKKAEKGINNRVVSKEDRSYPFSDELGNYRKTIIEKKNEGSYSRKTMEFPILGHKPREGKRWQIGEEKAKILEKLNRFIYDEGIVKLKIYDYDDKDTTSAYPNLLTEHGSTDSATKDLKELLKGNYFDNPKPVQLIKQLCIFTDTEKKEQIILDFFSGSATTAHAVMQLNAEDGGNRKFIMVQVPEPCDEKSEYKNICEIGKERIRRAGEKIVADTGRTDLDIGFRVFKLDSSNMKDVYFTPDELIQKEGADIEDLADNVKPDRTPADLLFGVMQYWNMTECLGLPHATKEIDGRTIHIIQDGQFPELVACFDADVPETVIKEMAALNPLRAVFRERCFKTTQDRLNAERLLKNADIRLI